MKNPFAVLRPIRVMIRIIEYSLYIIVLVHKAYYTLQALKLPGLAGWDVD